MTPSPTLIGKFETDAAELEHRAVEQETNAAVIAAAVEKLQAEQDREAATMQGMLARVEEMRAQIGDREDRIEDGHRRAAGARLAAEQMRTDAAYLAAAVKRVRDVSTMAGVAALVDAGQPMTPAELHTTVFDIGARCSIPGCGQQIALDASGWYHIATNSQYCREEDDSPKATPPAPAALVVDDASAEVA